MENIVDKIIRESEEEMPRCYTTEAYRMVLANKISNKHIARLKRKR